MTRGYDTPQLYRGDALLHIRQLELEISFQMEYIRYLEATLPGAVVPPVLAQAATADELQSCASCYKISDLTGTLQRVQITAPDGELTAGALTLRAHTGRKNRWDLFVVK